MSTRISPHRGSPINRNVSPLNTPGSSSPHGGGAHFPSTTASSASGNLLTSPNSSFNNSGLSKEQLQLQQQQQLPPLVINPKTILMAILKFLFICANVAFAIYASKVVFCSTFFVGQPTQWQEVQSTLTDVQKELATLSSFGDRFFYCVKYF